jgi:F-type H+-transporting ATPase subunit epsilon
LGIGELAYRTSTSSQPIAMAVISGFAEVLPDRVTVLAETAERAEEIDLARAEAAKARAEKRLSAGDTNIDWDRLNISLQRSIIRIQVARKYRGVPVESR